MKTNKNDFLIRNERKPTLTPFSQKRREYPPMTKEELIKLAFILAKREYFIMVEDREHTHNINCHTFSCFAVSKDEAFGKMYLQHPHWIHRKILDIRIY